jgi:hypothetical protein
MADESAKRDRFGTWDGADAGAASDWAIFFQLAEMNTTKEMRKRMRKSQPEPCVKYLLR